MAYLLQILEGCTGSTNPRLEDTMRSPSTLCILFGVVALAVWSVPVQASGGCINCVNVGGFWQCQLTESSGGTTCSTLSGCAVGGDCTFDEGNGLQGPAPMFSLKSQEPLLREVATTDPKAAISLLVASQLGNMPSPFRVYWTRNSLDRKLVHGTLGSEAVERYLDGDVSRGNEVIVHKITISRDPKNGKLYALLQELDPKTEEVLPDTALSL